MSYGIAKRVSRKGDKFGTGEIEGVVAPETVACSAGTSALLSMRQHRRPGCRADHGAVPQRSDLTES